MVHCHVSGRHFLAQTPACGRKGTSSRVEDLSAEAVSRASRKTRQLGRKHSEAASQPGMGTGVSRFLLQMS